MMVSAGFVLPRARDPSGMVNSKAGTFLTRDDAGF
jgi:hypothetical protein